MDFCKYFFCGFITFLSFNAFSSEQIAVARAIIVESCTTDLTDCRKVTTENPSSVNIPFSHAGKGKGGGDHGVVRFQSMQGDTPFKGEIHINKPSTGQGYSIYAVLRSGHGTKRHGVSKNIKVDDFSKFKPMELVDRPILIDGKTYRAKLVISSVL